MVSFRPLAAAAAHLLRLAVVRGRYNRDRGRRGWRALFDIDELVHNHGIAERIVVAAEGDDAFTLPGVDALWRRNGGDAIF